MNHPDSVLTKLGVPSNIKKEEKMKEKTTTKQQRPQKRKKKPIYVTFKVFFVSCFIFSTTKLQPLFFGRDCDLNGLKK